MVNKVIFIGRLGKNAEVKTAQNNKEYVVFSLATSENWKNEKGDYENRTEWHRVYAWSNLSSFAKTLQKGQLITLEGKIKYREVSEEVEGITFKHSIAEIHATSMKRLSKVEVADDPTDGASEDDGAAQTEPEIILSNEEAEIASTQDGPVPAGPRSSTTTVRSNPATKHQCRAGCSCPSAARRVRGRRPETHSSLICCDDTVFASRNLAGYPPGHILHSPASRQ